MAKATTKTTPHRPPRRGTPGPSIVRYLGASVSQINWGGNDDPRPLFKIGQLLHVRRSEIHSFHTKIELEEALGKMFNDASFEYLD